MSILYSRPDWKGVRESTERLSFAEFVQLLSPEKLMLHDVWRTQVEQCMVNQISYHFVGRYESLEADTTAVLRMMNRSSEIFPTSWNSNSMQNTEYLASNYYTEQIRRKIEQLYAVDFEVFNYTKYNGNTRRKE
mmetsp:Transcript_3783/g.6613  ORF Transcript_3783/g.6613 Transcript_3783/m.6613 type:complete len:134 (-) Transcript_3783:1233-1634(-)